MIFSLSIVALLLVAVTMGLALAHALEFPGKLRLDERTYRQAQEIYYPGFTIGGFVGEFGSMLLLPVILWLTPPNIDRFWWTATALGFLLASHAVYWMVTHPVNSAWLKDTSIDGPGRFFFGLFASPDGDWRKMRSVWEWSHVARACLATASFLSLSLAIAR